jgi:hypothetical protein
MNVLVQVLLAIPLSILIVTALSWFTCWLHSKTLPLPESLLRKVLDGNRQVKMGNDNI